MLEILVRIGGFGSDIIHPLTAHRIFGEIGAGNRTAHPSWFFVSRLKFVRVVTRLLAEVFSTDTRTQKVQLESVFPVVLEPLSDLLD